MKTEIIQIGNSKGIRIPKTLLRQCNLDGTVYMEIENGKLVVAALKNQRSDWGKYFELMANSNDDELTDYSVENSWDEKNWTW